MAVQSFCIKCDLTAINAQVAELQELLKRLPEGISNSFSSRIADLLDFNIETENLPAVDAGSYILSFKSVALAELIASALGALHGNSA